MSDLEAISVPTWRVLTAMWKWRIFTPFAETKKGVNIRQISAFESLFDDDIDELMFGGGARGGKSWLGCTWILFNALTMPKSGWLIIRKDLLRIKDTTVPTMIKVLAAYGIPSSEYEITGANSGATIRFTNGSIVYFRGGGYDVNDPNFDRFGSYDLTGVFLEECQELTYKLVSILRARFSVLEGDSWKTRPKILMTCNPAKTWIYSLFFDAQRKGTIKSYRRFIKALVTDNPNVSKEYIESLLKSDEITVQRLFYGNFDYDDDDRSLLTHDEILSLFTSDYVEMDIEDKKLIVDPALTGKDGCGINVFYGLVCVERVNLMKLTPVEFVKAVRATKDRHHIPNHKIIFDGSGLGALATASFEGAISYLGNASVIYKPNKVLPKDRRDEERPNFDMLGTQCGYKLAEMIKKGQIFYGPSCKLTEADKDSISEQLAQLKRRDMLDDRKLRLVVKDEIIANIGYSPTDFDILKMLAWFELKKEAEPKRRALRQEGHDM